MALGRLRGDTTMASRKEETVGRIYGITPSGEVIDVSVMVQGRSTRLYGPGGSRLVHPTNSGDSDGWVTEARLTYQLSDSVYIQRFDFHSEAEREQVNALRRKAGEIKKALEAKEIPPEN